jgi:hypothetical protein
VVTAEEYRQKALEADLRALRVSDPGARLAYQELAHGWRHLADYLDWLARDRKDDPPALRIQAKAANKVAVVRSLASRNRSLVRAVNRAAVASRNPANSSKSPDAKADNRISVKYYSSVRSFIPPVQPGDLFTTVDCNAR